MGGLVERMGIFRSPGPGILLGADKLKWKGIVRVGDTIYLEWKVTEMRKTSNPKWGIVKNTETLINQKGDVVLEVEITHLFGYKPV